MWNPTLGLHGGWDTAGVETVSVSVDRTNPEGDVAVCRANTMGTFAVVAEVNVLLISPGRTCMILMSTNR